LSRRFAWRDAGRTVVFADGALSHAEETLAGNGFERFQLLSTERALAEAPGLAAAATGVHRVEPGNVSDLAGELLDELGEGPLVALGGGRVIDVAKALAAVREAPAAAIPTTMSGAEMTASHRVAGGGGKRAEAGVRPALVVADPALMTSAPEEELRASSMNALAHGADTFYLPLSNPVSEMTALRGAALIAGALDEERPGRDNAALALGSLLCGYAIDSAGMGLHHLVCQTLVRFCGTPHAATNAAILPHSVALLAERAPELYGDFAEAIETEVVGLSARIEGLGRPRRLSELGADSSKLDEAIAAMLQRPELQRVPRPPTREELKTLAERAW
jgi:alcohol dehydrogenase class IV